jgi:hydroxymethylbilane synthase
MWRAFCPKALKLLVFCPVKIHAMCLSAREARTIDDLPAGAVVGTASLRRQSQILARRPDLITKPLRGNVDTRLKKIADGAADATVLAYAGLARLSLTNRISSFMETDVMLPAAAQGVIGIEIRQDDEAMQNLLTPIHSIETAYCVHAERAMLRTLDGNCVTPIAALATLRGRDELILEGLVAKPDGTSLVRLKQTGSVHQAEKIGTELGYKLKGRLPADFFAA